MCSNIMLIFFLDVVFMIMFILLQERCNVHVIYSMKQRNLHQRDTLHVTRLCIKRLLYTINTYILTGHTPN